MYKNKLKLMFMGVALSVSVAFTGCSKKEAVEETTAPVETEDPFAINQSIKVIQNTDGSKQQNIETSPVVDSGENTETVAVETEPGDTRTEWEIQESYNVEMDESNAAEEQEEEESYINSDERYELAFVYDRTEGDTLVFKNVYASVEGEGEEEGSGELSIQTGDVEYKVNRTNVPEGIDELNSGDLAILTTNMAYDENNQLYKVWKIVNTTKEMEEAELELEDQDSQGEQTVQGE